MKKILSIMLTLAMMLSMVTAAFAADTYSITVTNNPSTSNVSIAGETFKAYKILDMTVSEDGEHYAYTVADEFADFRYDASEGAGVQYVEGQGLINYLLSQANLEDSAITDDQIPGIQEVKNDRFELFAESVYNYVKEKGIAAAQEAVGAVAHQDSNGMVTSETAVFNLEEQGYYLVINEDGLSDYKTEENTVYSACILTVNNPDAEIVVKAGAPSADKKINYDEALVEGSSHEIGDVIPFYLTGTVPDLNGYETYTYIFRDTMSSGLTLDASSIKVYGDKYDATTGSYKDGQLIQNIDYSLEVSSDGQSFTITMLNMLDTGHFDGSTIQGYREGSLIQVFYNAKLNEKALTTTSEVNKFTIEYSNNPYTNTTETTPEEDAKVYDFDIRINKTDEDGNPLEGVEFILFKIADGNDGSGYYDGQLLLYDYLDNPASDTDAVSWWHSDKYDDVKSPWDLETIDEVFNTDDFLYTFIDPSVGTARSAAGTRAIKATDANGKLSFTGLEEGQYVLVEVSTVDGFNMLDAPIFVDISVEYENEDKSEINYDSLNSKISFYYYKNNNTTAELIQTADLTEGVTQLGATVTVENTSGIKLPSTGGMGTTLFYLIGGILVLGSVVVFVTKRRMNGTEE